MAKYLTVVNGKLRIDWGDANLILSESEEDPCCCGGGCEILQIIYDWTDSSSKDLDTGTTFLGTKVGFSCGSGGAYISWSGDNTATSAAEYVLIYFKAALDNDLWSGSVTVDLAAGWYSPAGGSGPAKVRVLCYTEFSSPPESADPQEKQINPGSQNNCASTSVGSVTINEDGTFTLN